MTTGKPFPSQPQVGLRHDEQVNEEYYDDRSEADDDVEKGKIKFPHKKLYGRDKELERLHELYQRMLVLGGKEEQKDESESDSESDAPQRPQMEDHTTPKKPRFMGQVIFLPGYAGTGKSSLVRQFIRQLEQQQQKPLSRANATTSGLPSVGTTISGSGVPRFISGKYDELFSSEPYSAIADGITKFFSSVINHDYQPYHPAQEKNDTLTDDGDKCVHDLAELRISLEEALGGYGTLLMEFIPNLSFLLDNEQGTETSKGGNINVSIHSSSSTGSKRGAPTSIRAGRRNSLTDGSGGAPGGSGVVKNVFHNLMKSLCTKEHPLVLFLDDLQWMDHGSMDLLGTLLSDSNLKYLFFIGSFRSNEVTDDDHPLSILMKDLESKRSNNTLERLELHDLSVDHTVEFIADTLGLEQDEVRPLAQAIQKKTLGNIFFTMQALEELVRRNGLYYDVMFFRWQWNLAKIQTENQLSAGVVAMVVSKMQSLPNSVRKILMVASYTKASVDLGTLLEIITGLQNSNGYSDISPTATGNRSRNSWGSMEDDEESKSSNVLEDLYDCLRKGVDEGLLTASSQMDPTVAEAKRAAPPSGKKLQISDATTVEYTFVHDRIQEAAQALLENKDERNFLRLNIAKTLERLSRTDRGKDWMLFTAAHTMNVLPWNIVDQDSPPGYLARVNLKAGKLAMGRSAFRQAVELFRCGVKCLENGLKDKKWSYSYALCLDMYNHVLETEYTVGNKEEAQAAVDQVLANAVRPHDKLCAQFHHIEILTSGKDRNFKDAILKGIEFLAEHGVILPSNPSEGRVVKERLKYRMVRGRRTLLDMLNIPRMDEDNQRIMRLVSQLSHSSLMAGQMHLCMIVNLTAMKLSWELGLNIHLPPMLAIYSSVLRRQGKLAEACHVADAAEQMLHQGGEGRDWVRGMVVTRGGSISMQVPYADCIDVCNTMHRVGVSCGDCQWGLSGGIQYCIMFFAAGAPVNALFEARMILCEEQCKSYGLSTSMVVTFRVFRQTLLNLHGKYMSNPTVLIGKALNEESALADFDGDTLQQAFRDISIMRMMLACIFTDERAMEEMIARFSKIPEYDLVVPRQHLKDAFVGLAALFLARRRKQQHSLSKQYLKLGRDKIQAFQKLVQIGSKNATPALLCLRAEEKPSKSNYDKAIRACSEAGMLHLEALIIEWYGLQELEKGEAYREVAEDYLSKALWIYQDWSATGKVSQMRQKHQFLKLSRKTAPAGKSFTDHWSGHFNELPDDSTNLSL
jgi:predicted ATPase